MDIIITLLNGCTTNPPIMSKPIRPSISTQNIDSNEVLYKQAIDAYEDEDFAAALYRFGSSVNKDIGKAVYWYGQAARRGNAEAQLALGMMYYNGTKIPKNLSKAKKLLSAAAKQGNTDAKHVLQKMNQ